MPEYLDIYVISADRTAESARRFLDELLPERQESADEYEIPQYSTNGDAVLGSDTEVVEYCCAHSEVDYRIYWRSLKNFKPGHAMAFYLRDGSVIYGLSTDAGEPELAKSLLRKLKTSLNSEHGYIAWESSPDMGSYEEFLTEVEKHAAVE